MTNKLSERPFCASTMLMKQQHSDNNGSSVTPPLLVITATDGGETNEGEKRENVAWETKRCNSNNNKSDAWKSEDLEL